MNKKIQTVADMFKFSLCDGAKRTLAIIRKEGKLTELKDLLNKEFSDLTSEQMDDILYYGRSWMYEELDMDTHAKETDKINRIMGLIEKDYILGLSLVRSVNSYDGSLEHLEFYDMEEFNSYTEYINHLDLVSKIYYGKGFNPRDAFFKFDGYENLQSCSQWEAKNRIINHKEEIAQKVIELWGYRYFDICEDDIIEILEEN